ncbi:Tol-Pal system beta propeller repeat protein TolB [bacterium]|nr:Tol-Pal system beta propeller repeat protein TolB [bacterium]
MMTIRKNSVRRAILAACLLPAVLAAQEDVRLRVRSEGFRRIYLEPEPFTGDQRSDVPERLRRMIIADLDLSGFFTIILPDSGSAGRWRFIPSSSVGVKGNVDLAGGDLQLSMTLDERPSGQTIISKEYRSSLRRIRDLAHECADDIVLFLTGYTGISTTRIVFVSEQGESKELSVIDFDGSNRRQLTRNRSLNISPCWSPDGNRLAFTSFFSGNPDLVIFDLASREYTNISRVNELHSAPAWSPDGNKIALSLTQNGNADIYTVRPDGSGLQRLTHSPAIESSPAWSPDGREIVFTSGRSGGPQLYLMDADGGNVRRLTYEGRYNDSADWSPRGGSVAFVTRDEGGFQICTIDVTGQNLQRLTDSAGSNENPTWSPNGMWLTFASSRSGRWDIYIISRDGTDLRRLTEDGGNVSPAWSPAL